MSASRRTTCRRPSSPSSTGRRTGCISGSPTTRSTAGSGMRSSTGPTCASCHEVYVDIVTSADGRYVSWISSEGPSGRPDGSPRSWCTTPRPATRSSAPVRAWAARRATTSATATRSCSRTCCHPRRARLLGRRRGQRRLRYGPTCAPASQSAARTSRFDDYQPTVGYEYSSPDGAFQVDASVTGKLQVSPRQPDFGHKWQTQGGWLGDHVMQVLVQDRVPVRLRPDQARPRPRHQSSRAISTPASAGCSTGSRVPATLSSPASACGSSATSS